MAATTAINLEFPYDTHSDYHMVGISQPAFNYTLDAQQKQRDILVQGQYHRSYKLPQ